MMNICNDGCPSIVTGDCVTYTGSQINNPVILPNNTFNQIVGTLVNTINASSAIINSNLIDISTVDSVYMNANFPSVIIGGIVVFTNLIGVPTEARVSIRVSNTAWIMSLSFNKI